jgi:hypothetical protein
MSRLIDLTGCIFSRLTVLSRAGSNPQGQPIFFCQCTCGKQTKVQARALRNGQTRSCGCLARELTSARSHRHGHATCGESPEYRSWQAMKARTTNPNDPSFRIYGGRGITVAPEWLNSFEAFYRDLGPRPPGTTLDRIDNSDGYHKANCRWTDAKTQRANQRPRSEWRRAA